MRESDVRGQKYSKIAKEKTRLCVDNGKVFLAAELARDHGLILSANLHDISSRQVSLVAQGAEDGVLAVEEVQDGVELGDFAGVHDKYSIVVGCMNALMSLE